MGIQDTVRIAGETTVVPSPDKEIESLIKSAKKAIEEEDAKELYKLFQAAIHERGLAVEMVGLISKHYLGSKDSPRYEPSSDVVGSMERVALAAIELATITSQRKESK